MSHCFDFMWMCRTTCFTTRPQLIKANGSPTLMPNDRVSRVHLRRAVHCGPAKRRQQ